MRAGKPGSIYDSVFCTPDQRETLGRLLQLPSDGSQLWLWRLTDYLLFGSFLDDETDQLILSQGILASIQGCGQRDGRLRGMRMIQDYQRITGVKMRIKGYNKQAGLARQLSAISWPDGVENLADQIRRPVALICERVRLDTGRPFNDALIREQRLNTKEEALERACKAKNADAERLLSYLNERPHRLWHRVSEHLPALRKMAAELKEEATQTYAFNILLRIEMEPMPFYGAVEKSTRIYSISSTVLQLPRAMRKELMRLMGWHAFDLSQAQLAIVAKIWEVEVLQEFLKADRNLWQELLSELSLDREHKPVLKTAVYSLIFGAGNARMSRDFERVFGVKEGRRLFRHWKRHPIICELLKARERVKIQLEQEGSAVDAYGIAWEVARTPQKKRNGVEYTTSNVRSVMACVAQSYELKILSPTLDLFECKSRGTHITYWLHDGLGIAIARKDRGIVKKMIDGVNARARELGILTRLERE